MNGSCNIHKGCFEEVKFGELVEVKCSDKDMYGLSYISCMYSVMVGVIRVASLDGVDKVDEDIR